MNLRVESWPPWALRAAVVGLFSACFLAVGAIGTNVGYTISQLNYRVEKHTERFYQHEKQLSNFQTLIDRLEKQDTVIISELKDQRDKVDTKLDKISESLTLLQRQLDRVNKSTENTK
jgi:peptidoglycan hydrolase CwlO-like protein